MGEFNPEWLSRVPDPPSTVIDDDGTYEAGLARLRERGAPSNLEAVWYWTNRLAASLPEVRSQLQGIRYTSRIAAGFIEELDGAFGVIVYTESPLASQQDTPFGTSHGSAREPFSVQVDGLPFPVVVRDTVVERHWCTAPEVLSPSQARATCWVRSPSRNYEGWLVPRHAVDPLNTVVDFDDGGSGTVVDHFGECIDSVVVLSDRPPQGLLRANACWPVPSGTSLEITDSPGNHQPLTVIDTDMNLGVLSDIVFPIRFSTDWTGHAGQSGALIIEPSLGEPAGSYLGVLHPSVVGYIPPGMSAAPSSTGYAQTCHQLEKGAGMEFMV